MAAIEIVLSISEILQGSKNILVFKKINENNYGILNTINHESSLLFLNEIEWMDCSEISSK